MSTYATTVWIDLRPHGPVADVARALVGLRDPSSPAGDVWVDVEAGWVRLTTYLPMVVEVTHEISAILVTAGEARAAVAEDGDEFGACWVVLAASDGAVRTVHRRYVLNADPRNRRQVRHALKEFVLDGAAYDPRDRDVAGSEAVVDAARLFDVDPARVLAAEVRAVTAFEEIGVVGGPFPWIEALGLVWPGPGAGRPFVA